MRKLSMAALATLAAASTVTGPVAAATVTTNLGVKIVIEEACVVATPSDLDFGTHGVLDAALTEETKIGVTCTTGTAYNVGLGGGSANDVTARTMTGTGGSINYAIYRNSGRTQNWGNTVGTDTVAGTGNGALQEIDVYGRVPAQTTPAAGTYTDTVAVTVTY